MRDNSKIEIKVAEKNSIYDCKFKEGQKVKIDFGSSKFHGQTGVVLGYSVITENHKLVALRMELKDESLSNLSNVSNSQGISFKTDNGHGVITNEDHLILV